MAEQVGCAVIATTGRGGQGRTPSEGGALVVELLEHQGHRVVSNVTVKDSALMLKGELAILGESKSCKVLLIVGDTRPAARNTPFDAVDRLLEKRFPGFGELFRSLMYQRIGAGAISAQATAGLYRGRLVYVFPEDPDSIRLAMEQLILPELSNMVDQIKPRI